MIYVQNKGGTFTKSAQTVYYRGREPAKTRGQGIHGNFRDMVTFEEFWVSGVKRRGSKTHTAEPGVSIVIDDDAQAEYQAILSSPAAL